MNRNYYAYFVMVNGKKRYGGALHANNMDEAAQKAAYACQLTVVPPTDAFSDYRLELEGERASLAVWAREEDLLN